MYNGIEVFKGRVFAEKVAVLPVQVRIKMERLLRIPHRNTIETASIILGDICGVLLGLRRSEFLASNERTPNRTTLLCFQNLAGHSWDLGDSSKTWNIVDWASKLNLSDIIRIRLCYAKHQRHRVAHEVVAGPGHQLMSFVFWLKVIVKLRTSLGEKLTVASPLLIRQARGQFVPLTGAFMTRMDKLWAPALGWAGATIHSRRRGFATAAARSGLHMASITIAMRHSQGVTMQDVCLSVAEKASITTRLAIGAYDSIPVTKTDLPPLL